jgi:hypothetical protein
MDHLERNGDLYECIFPPLLWEHHPFLDPSTAQQFPESSAVEPSPKKRNNVRVDSEKKITTSIYK